MLMSLYKSLRNIGVVILFVGVMLLQPVSGGTGGPYVLEWTTIDGGGGVSSGGAYTLSGTIGQHDAGTVMTGGIFNLTGGFWPGMQGVVCYVNLEHFAQFAEQWLAWPCDGGNDFCKGADLDMLGDVDLEDVRIFADWWLDYCPLDWPFE